MKDKDKDKAKDKAKDKCKCQNSRKCECFCVNKNCCNTQDDLRPLDHCEFIWVIGKDKCGDEHQIKLSLKGLKIALDAIVLDDSTEEE